MASYSRDLVRSVAAQGIVMAISLGTGILTARVLGPADRGFYSLCLAVQQFALSFGGMEIGQSTIYHAARGRLAYATYFGANLTLSALLALLSASAVWLLAPTLQGWFEGLPESPLFWTAAFVVVSLFGEALTQTFRALDRFDLFNGIRIVDPILKIATLSGAFLLGGGLVGALQALIVSDTLLGIVVLILLLRIGRPRIREGIAQWGAFLRFGARLEAVTAVAHIHLRITVFLVAYYLRPEDVAFFAIGEGIVQRLLALPTTVGTVLLPKIALEDDARAADLTAATSRTLVLVMGAVVGFLLLTAQWLVVWLYGQDYAPAIQPMWVLLPLALFRSVSRVLSRFIVVTNRLRALTLLNVLCLALHVPLLMLLVPRYGTVGAAAAASTSYLFHMLGTVVVFRSLSGIPLRAILLVDRADLKRMRNAGLQALRRRAPRPT